MTTNVHVSCNPINTIILPPAYPFASSNLFTDLRDRLSRERGQPIGIEEISEMMGTPKSTAHFWLFVYRNPQVLALMTLIERLSPAQRRLFIESHCRAYPSLSHPRLSPAQAKLKKLLSQEKGMSILTGGTDKERTFVLTALGHSWAVIHGRRHAPTGIDIHRPREFVPVATVRYIDESLARSRVSELVLSVWSKILTAGAPIMLFNGLWSQVPSVRLDLLRRANLKHVILAEDVIPSLAVLRKHISTPIQILTVSKAGGTADGIRVSVTRVGPENMR